MQENRLFEALLDVIPFSAYAVDVNTHEVVYANKLCSENMYAPRAKNCWEKLYGQEHICSWCKIEELKRKEAVYKNEKVVNDFFDESSDKWFQSYTELVKWPDGRTVKYSISVDITAQKEIQANMIKTNTKLSLKTKELEALNKKLEYMAKKDHLTGINNRGNFFALGTKLLEEAKEKKQSLFVAMIDIDNFKNVNDTYGHSAGDKVLKIFTKNIEDNIDEKDLFGRLGGEEFALVFINQKEDEVIKKANELKDIIANLNIEYKDKKINFTISIGLASLCPKDNILDLLLDRADKSLYSAKNDGKNKVKFRGIKC